MAKRNRYKKMEKLMTAVLIADGVLFLMYLITAGAGVLWMKWICGILSILVSGAGLVFLYKTKELLKQRSLWLSSGFFAIAVTVLASLILAFP